jgi:hypothetical protein
MNIVKTCLAASLAVLLGATFAKADTAISVQQAAKTGLTLSPTNTGLVAGNTYQFRNDGRTFLLFVKTGAGASSIAVGVQQTVAGLAVSSATFSVPATTGNVVAGPFPPAIFNDANGDTHFSISDTVGLSVSAVKL